MSEATTINYNGATYRKVRRVWVRKRITKCEDVNGEPYIIWMCEDCGKYHGMGEAPHSYNYCPRCGAAIIQPEGEDGYRNYPKEHTEVVCE